MLIRELLHSACLRLGKAGIEDPDRDVALLLGHCLEKSRTALYLMGDESISKELEKHFLSLLQRREQREPLAYILGVQEFWSLDFLVSPDVLIPRPETELLVERAIKVWRESSQPPGRILDLCCGSGVIAIVLAKELGRKVLAIDLSMKAIMSARENARRHGVSHLVDFLQSDLLSALAPVPCFSLVVSNPPYVSQQELADGLQPEVDRYEPHLALNGGDKGLEIIKRIDEELRQRMLPGADLFMEIGADQGGDILSLFADEKKFTKRFTQLIIEKDYAEHDRIFHAKLEIE
ncbi:MAG: peptide chain release factor N(5)-glutamine methyltransferase [Desulfocapsa sp.]|uniref:Release factor glutamine methyltransferase n=1 Tax=Desulfotalea psychrophila TaxID=84980 RepID=A0ABS3ATQ5_9BACT|nr:peptide chain release factor N(5)-glutamine methyltransferase [Desulfocapsa sp.]MBN4067992.1 peptide chain release factor N(5)-glutamine methyltransferase [Desulfotalea psychrophila]